MYSPRLYSLTVILALSAQACHLIYPFDAEALDPLGDGGQPSEAGPQTEAGWLDGAPDDLVLGDGPKKDAALPCQPPCGPGELCLNGACVPGCADPGLLMHLSFNGSAADTAGGGIEQPLSGASSLNFDTTDGKPQPSLVRGGGTAGINYAGSNFNAAAGTVVLWLRLTDWSMAYSKELYAANFPGGSFSVGIDVPKGGAKITLYTKVQGTTPLSGFCGFTSHIGLPGNPAKWNLLAFVWDPVGGGAVRLYWDLYGNFLSRPQCKLSTSPVVPTSVRAGGGAATSLLPGTGFIDELMVFNRALTVTELKGIASTGCP